jgi:TonB family protein
VSGVVLLDTTIGADGRVIDTRVIRSLPLLDRAAIDAVRQWEFAVPLVDGRPAAVVARVVLNFQLEFDSGGATTLDRPLPKEMPRDFAFAYERHCDTRGFLIDEARDMLEVSNGGPASRLGFTASEAQAVYRELLAIGLFDNRNGLATWSEPVRAGTILRDDGVEVTAAAPPVFVSIFTTDASRKYNRRFVLRVRGLGEWTRAWPAERIESRPPGYEKQIRAVSELIERTVNRKDVWRLVPRSLRSCPY